MVQKNFFITGATGFIGRHVVAELLKQNPNAHISVLTRSEENFPKCRVIRADLDEIEKHQKNLEEADVIFHCAANARFSSHCDYEKDNVIPLKKMLQLLQLCENFKHKHFVFISSIAAIDRHSKDRMTAPLSYNSIPNPRSAYGKSKLAGEELVKKSGMRYTIVRPSWVYGEGMRPDSHVCAFAGILEKNLGLAHFDFPGKVTLVHVKDLTKGIVQIPFHPETYQKDFFVGTENQRLGKILSDLATQMTGDKPIQIPIPTFFPIRYLHTIIPIQITNLFYPYFTCESLSFWKATQHTPLYFWKNHIAEVVNSTQSRRGFVVITGANSGIGKAIAQVYKQRGQNILLVDKNIDQIKDWSNSIFEESPLKTQSNQQIFISQVDLSDFQQIDFFIKRIQHLPISILINNAGLGFKGNFEELSIEQIKSMICVNIEATLFLTHGLLSHLKRNKSVIINITSSTAIHPLPNMAVYSASKSFLRNWSYALSEELKKTNHVLTFAPSGTKTQFQKSAGVKINHSQGLHSPEWVANQILLAIKKKKRFVEVGKFSQILNHISYLLPLSFRLRLWSFLFRANR